MRDAGKGCFARRHSLLEFFTTPEGLSPSAHHYGKPLTSYLYIIAASR